MLKQFDKLSDGFGFNLYVCISVPSGWAVIDDDHRDPHLFGMLNKPVSTEHFQGCSQAHKHIAALHQMKAIPNSVSRHIFAEKYDMRPQASATLVAIHHANTFDEIFVQIVVSVWPEAILFLLHRLKKMSV